MKRPSRRPSRKTFLWDFSDKILVRCPHCKACAHLTELRDSEGDYNGSRLVCPCCALDRDWRLDRDGSVPRPGVGPRLSGFDVDLWLVTDCCGEQLWAYNREHLDFLANYVAAKSRPKAVDSYGWSTRCMEACLPRWMILGKHRSEVLRGIEKLLA